jgi:hypothetical protein
MQIPTASNIDFINFKTNLLSIQHQEEIYSLIGGKSNNKKSKDLNCLNIDLFRQNGMFSLKPTILNDQQSTNLTTASATNLSKSSNKLITDMYGPAKAGSTNNVNEIKSTISKTTLIFTKSSKRPKTSKT